MDRDEQRPAPAAYTPDEVAVIRRAMAARERLTCPGCGSQLHSGTPVAGGGGIAAIRELRCDPYRVAVIGNAPAGG